MVDKRNQDLPDSGVVGIRWNKDRRKWEVRFKVNGVETYLDLHADLDEAQRVLAAGRLDQEDQRPYPRDDSTARLTDAEIAERIVLDDDGDPIYGREALRRHRRGSRIRALELTPSRPQAA